MTRPPEHQNGAYDANSAPPVYHPHGAETAAYEEYTDPAAAHGWQNAYDETAQLPRVDGGRDAETWEPEAGPEPEPVPDWQQAWEGGRAERRRAQRRGAVWRSPRVLAAAGAVGVVSLAALVAGVSFAGSSDDSEGKHGGGTQSVPDFGSSSDAADSDTPSGSDSGEPSPSASASGSAGASPDASASPSASGSRASSAPSGAASTSSSDSGPGNSDNKGKGSTKGPR